MKISEFHYELPKSLIAQYPSKRRGEGRLLVLKREGIEHRCFKDIKEYFQDGDTLVLNETEVIPARLRGVKRDTGAKVEVLLNTKVSDTVWEALIRPKRKVKVGTRLHFGESLNGELTGYSDSGLGLIRFEWEGDFHKVLERVGEIPLPSYIKRRASDVDKERYQTIYARKKGSVAAPTAGLHFNSQLLEELKEEGIEIVKILLHVGVGTFLPLRVKDVEMHKMKEEYYEISAEASERINQTKGRIIAVGTTTVRALESASDDEGKVFASKGWANLFIYPGYKFKVMDALLTNFHPPKSTSLLLVCAFAGVQRILTAYNEALSMGYRFLSYGDCMLIFGKGE